MKISTTLISFFLIFSILPILFIGGMDYQNAKISLEREIINSLRNTDVNTNASNFDSNSHLPTSVINLRNTQIVVVLTTVAVVAIFAYFISRSIFDPITKLTESAKQIASGNLDLEVNLSENTNDEIKTLSSNFNKMRLNMKTVNEGLNELVAARTKELSDSNEQLQEIYQQLVKLDLAKEEFITMVSHELKTPLTPIKVYGEILLKETKGSLNDNQKKAVAAIVRNTEKLRAFSK